jgi:hypothetical protein
MLRLAGRLADGILPSLSYLPGGADDYAALNAEVDAAAEKAGRSPSAVRRLLNINGTFTTNGTSFLEGPPEQWAEDLAGVALEHGVSAFILATDNPAVIDLYAAEVAPAVRALVAAERS